MIDLGGNDATERTNLYLYNVRLGSEHFQTLLSSNLYILYWIQFQHGEVPTNSGWVVTIDHKPLLYGPSTAFRHVVVIPFQEATDIGLADTWNTQHSHLCCQMVTVLAAAFTWDLIYIHNTVKPVLRDHSHETTCLERPDIPGRSTYISI